MRTEHSPKYAERDEQVEPAALRQEQQREAAEAWPVTGSALGTDAQAKGFLVGLLVGGAIGAVLIAPFGFIPMGDLALWTRLVLCAAVGALAGGTAGVLYFGGREPELEGETVDADGRPSVGSTLRDPETDELGRRNSG